MKSFCEDVVADLLPTLRALIAKQLTQNYGFTQHEAAEKLGITQAAVSQYTRELRGYRERLANNKKIFEFVKNIAGELATEDIDKKNIPNRFCDICRRVRKEDCFQ